MGPVAGTVFASEDAGKVAGITGGPRDREVGGLDADGKVEFGLLAPAYGGVDGAGD